MLSDVRPIRGLLGIRRLTYFHFVHPCGLTITNWYGSAVNLEAYSQASTMRLVDCVIVGNRNSQGGGVRIYRGTLTASNCVIRGNESTSTSYSGGGVNFLSGYANGGALFNCEISGNIAAGWGGGVMAGNPITVRNCTISNNVGGAYGGGIASLGGTWISNCRIVRNLARVYYGGGAYGGMIDNSLIAYNSATSSVSGGAYGAWLRNCTVVSNLANRGGGTHASKALNSIVYNNRAKESGYTGYSNYLYDAAAGWTNCCTAPSLGTRCTTGDPKFESRAAGNFRLTLGSPCVDAGLYEPWMANAVDLDGRRRVQRAGVDIGAYELLPAGSAIVLH
jgi:hypothetical protein